MAQPPTNTAVAVLRAGLTEVFVTGMLIRWISVSAEADGETRESYWSAFVGRAEDDEQEHERHHDFAHEPRRKRISTR